MDAENMHGSENTPTCDQVSIELCDELRRVITLLGAGDVYGSGS